MDATTKKEYIFAEIERLERTLYKTSTSDSVYDEYRQDQIFRELNRLYKKLEETW